MLVGALVAPSALSDLEQDVTLVALAAIFGLLLVAVFFVQIVVVVLVRSQYKAVPAGFRRMSLGALWISALPLIGVLWNFVMVLRVSDSFRDALEAAGRPQSGDYGKLWGLAFAVGALITHGLDFFTGIGGVLAIGGLVLWLVKLNDMKQVLRRAGA
jgi:hypothetical protein